MAMQDDIQQFGKELIQWQGPRVLGFEQTLDLLQSEHRQIRMWAVYQLIECWQERAAEFVHLLLESEIAESREAAIYLVGRYHLRQFAFPIFGLFNRSGGPGTMLDRFKIKKYPRGLHQSSITRFYKFK